MRTLAPLLLVVALPAVAYDLVPPPPPPPEGIPLVITVVDAQTRRPIPFATVRDTQEKALKMVDRKTGQIVMTRLEPSYNDMVPLTKGMELTIEVTAAAYEPKQIAYRMRRRGNKLIVPLDVMKIPPNIGSDPIMQFGRDRPLDGADLPPDHGDRAPREPEHRR
jgi:hypothetical protein